MKPTTVILLTTLMCLPVASARTGYLLHHPPPLLGIEPAAPRLWNALAKLPPLDMGNTPSTNAPSVVANASASPSITTAPDTAAKTAETPVKDATPPEATITELLNQFLSAPGGTNLIHVLPGPVSFVPPAPPSSSATYLLTKP